MTNADRIEITQDHEHQYRWRAVASNGETIAVGEAYTRARDAARAAMATFPDVAIVMPEVEPDTVGADE